jgi:hypothetical protein
LSTDTVRIPRGRPGTVRLMRCSVSPAPSATGTAPCAPTAGAPSAAAPAAQLQQLGQPQLQQAHGPPCRRQPWRCLPACPWHPHHPQRQSRRVPAAARQPRRSPRPPGRDSRSQARKRRKKGSAVAASRCRTQAERRRRAHTKPYTHTRSAFTSQPALDDSPLYITFVSRELPSYASEGHHVLSQLFDWQRFIYHIVYCSNGSW